MEWWQYLLLVNLYLLLFYGFYALLLRSETFFQLNRVYLVASAVLSFLIPLIHADWVRALFITQKVQDNFFAYGSPIVVYEHKAAGHPHIDMVQVMLAIYLTGVAVLTLRLLGQLLALKRIINNTGPSAAFSFFNKIKVDSKLDSEDVIIAHEYVHVRQWHSADVLLMELVAIVNWFNPAVYFYRLGIKHIHEFIADRQAVKSGITKADYALLLLSHTFKTPTHQLVNQFFNHSLLKRRIMMLQKNRSQRAALLKYGLSAPLFILMLVCSSAAISSNKAVANIKAFEQNATDTTKRQTDYIVYVKGPKNMLVNLPDKDTAKDKHIFTSVEKDPEFKGGMAALNQFLRSNLKYPEAMRKNNIQGKVLVVFIVEKDGSLSHIVVPVTKNLLNGYGSAEEAYRVMKLSPKWQPGYQNGKTVRVQYALPISFSLEDSKNTNDSLNTDSHAKLYWGVAKDTLNTLQEKPLFLLDGKEITDINMIDSKDIQRIDVLKPQANDNSLIKMYGPKAEKGVVLITSKKGTKPSPQKN